MKLKAYFTGICLILTHSFPKLIFSLFLKSELHSAGSFFGMRFHSFRVTFHSFILRECLNTSAVVDTRFFDIYVDTENIPTCRYNIQHIDKRTMEI